jgi:hypothetical protein
VPRVKELIMGTNYYLSKKVCPHCERSEEIIHIGKSSGGWVFSLHVIPEEGINDIGDWKSLFSIHDNVIKDEYGRILTTEEMISVICDRSRKSSWDKVPMSYSSWEEFHIQNHSEEGPNGLLKRKVGSHCIANGEGTWDLVTGEFS